MLTWLRKHRRAAQTRRELNSLSNRELNDIGISRCDIERIAHDFVK